MTGGLKLTRSRRRWGYSILVRLCLAWDTDPHRCSDPFRRRKKRPYLAEYCIVVKIGS
jgi:hypothetical protein